MCSLILRSPVFDWGVIPPASLENNANSLLRLWLLPRPQCLYGSCSCHSASNLLYIPLVYLIRSFRTTMGESFYSPNMEVNHRTQRRPKTHVVLVHSQSTWHFLLTPFGPLFFVPKCRVFGFRSTLSLKNRNYLTPFLHGSRSIYQMISQPSRTRYTMLLRKETLLTSNWHLSKGSTDNALIQIWGRLSEFA